MLPRTNEDAVFHYFRCIEDKDLAGLMDLFDYDAIVYEPFSKVHGLRGWPAIEPFLKVALMANSNLKRHIEIEKPAIGKPDSSRISALVTFEKGDRVRGKFTFEFGSAAGGENGDRRAGKIKALNIQFL